MTGQKTIVFTFGGHWPLQIPLPGLLLALPRQEGPRDPSAAAADPSRPTAAPSRQFATAAAAPEEQWHLIDAANLATPPGIRVVQIPTNRGDVRTPPGSPSPRLLLLFLHRPTLLYPPQDRRSHISGSDGGGAGLILGARVGHRNKGDEKR